MKHYLYCTICDPTNLYYVGVHGSNNIEDDPYIGSGYMLKQRIKKFGIKAFTRVILKLFDSKWDAYKAELLIVDLLFLKEDNCLNLSFGGYGKRDIVIKKKRKKIRVDRSTFFKERICEIKLKK